MEKLIVILFLFLSPSTTIKKNSIDENYNFKREQVGIERYRQEINRAFSLLKKQKKLIDLELNKSEKVQILSVAFPETIRYDSYSDYLETSSNKILYVSKGKGASDFSTGYFQMKPSFLEDLENYVANTESLKSYDWILIQQKDEKAIRKERINRLENFQWQLKYLRVFWYAAEYKYQNIDFKTQEDKIRFFATAYNYGFTKPDNEITKYQFVKKFNPGEITDTEKVAYADFSIDFIKTYSYFFNQ